MTTGVTTPGTTYSLMRWIEPRIYAAVIVLGVGLAAVQLDAQQTIPTSKEAIAEGLKLLRSGQAAQAKLQFDAAVKAAPHSADALTWRGICENQMGQYPAAAADFQMALRFDNAMLSAHYNLALSLIRLKQVDQAAAQLRIVIAAEPQAIQPLYNLAILLEGKGSYAEARDHLTAAYALEPRDEGVILHLLIEDLRLKQTAELTPLLTALSGAATTPATERQAGAALLEAGRFPNAVTLLETARVRDPAATEIDHLLARAYLGDGRNAEAISLLEGTEPAAREEETSYLLALAYLGSGEVSKAKAMFTAAAQANPKDARPLYHLGLIAAGAPEGQIDAVRQLRSAYQMEPDDPAYALALARLLLATDDAEGAKLVLLKTVAVHGDAAQVHTLMGIASAATHEIAEAVTQLQTAINEDPATALAHNVLGFCFFQQGRYAQAAAAYGKASTLEPGRLLYAQDAALAYERANDNVQALAFAERANALSVINAGDHALLGKLYAASGRNEDAVRALQRAIELNPELDAPYYLLARTYQQMGNRQQAAAWSERLSALKQRHQSAFDLAKKVQPDAVRSSILLEGGSLRSDEAGAP